MVYLVVIFSCVGLLFGNVGALAMEPLGHVAEAGTAVVGSVSIFVTLPLGTLVGQSFDGTTYAQIAAFGVFGGSAFPAIRWAAGSPGTESG